MARTHTRSNVPFRFEALEPRTLLAYSGAEVELAELINRARANPGAEAARLSLDLTVGLTTAEQALLAPHEPLALSDALAQSARAHALDMATRNFFDHTNPDGLSPTNRAANAGYAGTAGENIGAGYPTIAALYQFWMSSPNERRNILSLYTNFDSTYHYDEIGVGLALNVSGAFYSSYYVADFGNPASHVTRLLGVVFDDADGSGMYNAGEGLASIRIDVFAGSSAAGSPVATYTTDASGYYQTQLASGSYTVMFTRLSDNYSVTKPAVVAGQNLEVSAKASELMPPPPPPDDYAGSGEWPLAAAVTLDNTGAGDISGALRTPGDSDLFVFTAPVGGSTTITGAPASGAFNARLRIYNGSQSLLTLALPDSATGAAAAQITLRAGARYYILIDAGATSDLTGGYTIHIDAPAVGSGPSVGPEYLVGDGLPVATTYYGVKPVVSFLNQQGRPIVAIRSALGTWSWYTDLVAATGSAEVNANANIPTWIDPSDNLLYAAVASPAGMLLFRRAANGDWSYRNLTDEIHVSRPIVSQITTFVNPAGLRQISGLDADGHLVTYWMTGQMWPQGWRYYFHDLSTRDLVYNNHPQPALSASEPIMSYATSVDTVNIVAKTDAGAVILFYRASGGLGQSLWNWANLTRITGAPAFVGEITARETSTGAVNISGTDASGNLWMITWRAGQGWRAANLATSAGGGAAPSIVAGSITSWADVSGNGYAAALTTGGDVLIYRFTVVNGQNTWTLMSLSASGFGGLLPTGPLRATSLANGAVLITACTSAGEAMRLTYTPGQTWSTENISDLLAP
jgi:uncharacterized protein YkwD